ncbi:50S ribosomal protein L3 [Candidatus Dependentiae bacterium]|nr:50S ribosomal protein L3 [Candidatus Dependentiae bacterium]
MSVCILGKKIGMTQIFQDDGSAVPVTVVEAGPCTVLQKKKSASDKYSAVQLGFDEKKPKNVGKPMLKHFEKAGSKPLNFVREMRLDNDEQVEKYEIGKPVSIDIFKKGEFVDVLGISKGKGFAGVMKRHNMGGGKGSHGTHEFFRHGGSVGQHSDPSRVFKGLRMPGRMGTEKVTSVNLEIVDIQVEKNLMLIRGAVPGRKNSYLVIKPSKHHTK